MVQACILMSIAYTLDKDDWAKYQWRFTVGFVVFDIMIICSLAANHELMVGDRNSLGTGFYGLAGTAHDTIELCFMIYCSTWGLIAICFGDNDFAGNDGKPCHSVCCWVSWSLLLFVVAFLVVLI